MIKNTNNLNNQDTTKHIKSTQIKTNQEQKQTSKQTNNKQTKF